MITFIELNNKYTPNNNSTNFSNNTCRRRLLDKYIGTGNWEYVYEGRKAIGINLINQEEEIEENKKAIEIITNKGAKYIILEEGEEMIEDISPRIVEINNSTKYENNAKEISKEYEEYLDLEDGTYEDPSGKYYCKLVEYIKDTLNLDENVEDIYPENYIDILREVFSKVKSDYESTMYSINLSYDLKEAIYEIYYYLYKTIEEENSKEYLNEKGIIYDLENYDIDKYVEFLNKNGIKARKFLDFGKWVVEYGDDRKISNNGIYGYIKFNIDGKECVRIVCSPYLWKYCNKCNKSFADEYTKFINGYIS